MKKAISLFFFFYLSVNFLSAQTGTSFQVPHFIPPRNFSGETVSNSLLIPRETYQKYRDGNVSNAGGIFQTFAASQTGFDFLLEEASFIGKIKNRIGLFSFKISIEIPDDR